MYFLSRQYHSHDDHISPCIILIYYIDYSYYQYHNLIMIFSHHNQYDDHLLTILQFHYKSWFFQNILKNIFQDDLYINHFPPFCRLWNDYSYELWISVNVYIRPSKIYRIILVSILFQKIRLNYYKIIIFIIFIYFVFCRVDLLCVLSTNNGRYSR